MDDYLKVYNHWELTLGDIAVDTFKEIYQKEPDYIEVYYLTHPTEIIAHYPRLRQVRDIIYNYRLLPYNNITFTRFIFNNTIGDLVNSTPDLKHLLFNKNKQEQFSIEEILYTLNHLNLPTAAPARILYRDVFNYYQFQVCKNEIFALLEYINGIPTLESLQKSQEKNLNKRNLQSVKMTSPEAIKTVEDMFRRRKVLNQKRIQEAMNGEELH